MLQCDSRTSQATAGLFSPEHLPNVCNSFHAGVHDGEQGRLQPEEDGENNSMWLRPSGPSIRVTCEKDVLGMAPAGCSEKGKEAWDAVRVVGGQVTHGAHPDVLLCYTSH